MKRSPPSATNSGKRTNTKGKGVEISPFLPDHPPMKPEVFSFLIYLVSLFLVAGCATAPPPIADAEAVWQAHQASLKPVTVWSIRGRLALRAADQGWHATLNWERNGENHRMDFTGPLGRGHLRLIQDSRGAELRDADQRVWREADAELLLYRATGWVVPLEGTYFWVLGRPAPRPAPERQLGEQGRL